MCRELEMLEQALGERDSARAAKARSLVVSLGGGAGGVARQAVRLAGPVRGPVARAGVLAKGERERQAHACVHMTQARLRNVGQPIQVCVGSWPPINPYVGPMALHTRC